MFTQFFHRLPVGRYNAEVLLLDQEGSETLVHLQTVVKKHFPHVPHVPHAAPLLIVSLSVGHTKVAVVKIVARGGTMS